MAGNAGCCGGLKIIMIIVVGYPYEIWFTVFWYFINYLSLLFYYYFMIFTVIFSAQLSVMSCFVCFLWQWTHGTGPSDCESENKTRWLIQLKRSHEKISLSFFFFCALFATNDKSSTTINSQNKNKNLIQKSKRKSNSYFVSHSRTHWIQTRERRVRHEWGWHHTIVCRASEAVQLDH